ncbi:MAG: sarcosine oxidase subunit delta, partial [Gemmatimonadales bacterium]
PRDVYEFTCGGQERGPRPAQEGLSAEAHFRYAQFRLIPPAPQDEWWYHRAGCGVWFKLTRNPATNREVSGGG